MICIHHNKDLDGFTSGAIVAKRFPDCKLIGWDYKDPIPWDKITYGEPVVMIDVSFPMVDMIKLLHISQYKLTIIDHHISFKKEFDASDHPNKKDITYVYENGKAACEIGWEYYFPGKDMPDAVRLLGQYDTWRNENKVYWENAILPFQLVKTFLNTRSNKIC